MHSSFVSHFLVIVKWKRIIYHWSNIHKISQVISFVIPFSYILSGWRHANREHVLSQKMESLRFRPIRCALWQRQWEYNRKLLCFVVTPEWVSMKVMFLFLAFTLLVGVVTIANCLMTVNNPPPRGGYFHQHRTWTYLPDLENLTISIPIFCLISHPSIYHFRKKSTQFWPNWVLLQYLAQNTPNLCNSGSFISDETPQSLYQILRKSVPKGRHIYVYYVNVRTPPGNNVKAQFNHIWWQLITPNHGCIHC